MRSYTLQAAPYPVQVVVGLLAYRKNMRNLYGQGTGRFSVEEIDSFRRQIWENMNAVLVAAKEKGRERDVGDGVFWALGGSEPSELDTVLFGFVVGALICTAYALFLL